MHQKVALLNKNAKAKMRAETVGSVENMSRDLNVFVYKWKGRDRKWPKESIFFFFFHLLRL